MPCSCLRCCWCLNARAYYYFAIFPDAFFDTFFCLRYAWCSSAARRADYAIAAQPAAAPHGAREWYGLMVLICFGDVYDALFYYSRYFVARSFTPRRQHVYWVFSDTRQFLIRRCCPYAMMILLAFDSRYCFFRWCYISIYMPVFPRSLLRYFFHALLFHICRCHVDAICSCRLPIHVCLITLLISRYLRCLRCWCAYTYALPLRDACLLLVIMSRLLIRCLLSWYYIRYYSCCFLPVFFFFSLIMLRARFTTPDDARAVYAQQRVISPARYWYEARAVILPRDALFRALRMLLTHCLLPRCYMESGATLRLRAIWCPREARSPRYFSRHFCWLMIITMPARAIYRYYYAHCLSIYARYSRRLPAADVVAVVVCFRCLFYRCYAATAHACCRARAAPSYYAAVADVMLADMFRHACACHARAAWWRHMRYTLIFHARRLLDGHCCLFDIYHYASYAFAYVCRSRADVITTLMPCLLSSDFTIFSALIIHSTRLFRHAITTLIFHASPSLFHRHAIPYIASMLFACCRSAAARALLIRACWCPAVRYLLLHAIRCLLAIFAHAFQRFVTHYSDFLFFSCFSFDCFSFHCRLPLAMLATYVCYAFLRAMLATLIFSPWVLFFPMPIFFSYASAFAIRRSTFRLPADMLLSPHAVFHAVVFHYSYARRLLRLLLDVFVCCMPLIRRLLLRHTDFLRSLMPHYFTMPPCLVFFSLVWLIASPDFRYFVDVSYVDAHACLAICLLFACRLCAARDVIYLQPPDMRDMRFALDFRYVARAAHASHDSAHAAARYALLCRVRAMSSARIMLPRLIPRAYFARPLLYAERTPAMFYRVAQEMMPPQYARCTSEGASHDASAPAFTAMPLCAMRLGVRYRLRRRAWYFAARYAVLFAPFSLFQRVMICCLSAIARCLLLFWLFELRLQRSRLLFMRQPDVCFMQRAILIAFYFAVDICRCRIFRALPMSSLPCSATARLLMSAVYVRCCAIYIAA